MCEGARARRGATETSIPTMALRVGDPVEDPRRHTPPPREVLAFLKAGVEALLVGGHLGLHSWIGGRRRKIRPARICLAGHKVFQAPDLEPDAGDLVRLLFGMQNWL